MRSLPLLAVCGAYALVILDATATNVALPAIGRDLGGSIDGLQWVLNAYTLPLAACLLAAGDLADRTGPRPVFCGGLLLFVLASLACAAAPSLPLLITARAAQGLGAAVALPASLASLAGLYPGREDRARALGVWGGVAGVAAGAGPIMGGALVTGLGWRWVFLLNVPVGGLALALAWWLLPRGLRRPSRRLDPGGQVLGTLALVLLVAGLIEGQPLGWATPAVLGCFAGALAAGLGFVLREGHVSQPLLPLTLFGIRPLAIGTAVGLLINLGFYGALLVLTLHLQQVLHLSALRAGAALLPMALMPLVGSTLAGPVTARFGPRLPMLTGLALGTAGYAALSVVLGPPSWLLALPLAVAGFGMALTMPAVTALVLEAVAPERSGLASGVLNAARQSGSAVGVALLPLLGGAAVAVGGEANLGLLAAAVAFALALGATMLLFRWRR